MQEEPGICIVTLNVVTVIVLATATYAMAVAPQFLTAWIALDGYALIINMRYRPGWRGRYSRRLRNIIAIACIAGVLTPLIFMDAETTLASMSNTLGAFVKTAIIMTTVCLVLTMFWQDPDNPSPTDHAGSNNSGPTNSLEEQPRGRPTAIAMKDILQPQESSQ